MSASHTEWTDDRVVRYSRQVLLPGVGGRGQEALWRSRVLVVGAGGLGCPALLYLAAAGVGTLGIADGDVVDLSNLQRQIAHTTASVGRSKVVSAAQAIAALNPEVVVVQHDHRLDEANAGAIVSGYDVVLDCTDGFSSRYLVHDAALRARRPLVTAAMLRFEGQLAVFRGWEADQPCYRCLFPEAPPDGLQATCSQAGVLGPLGGVMGALQAAEALKVLWGAGEALVGKLLVYDALDASFRTLRIPKDPSCAACRSPA